MVDVMKAKVLTKVRLVTVRDLRTAVEGVIKDKEIVSPLPGLNAG